MVVVVDVYDVYRTIENTFKIDWANRLHWPFDDAVFDEKCIKVYGESLTRCGECWLGGRTKWTIVQLIEDTSDAYTNVFYQCFCLRGELCNGF